MIAYKPKSLIFWYFDMIWIPSSVFYIWQAYNFKSLRKMNRGHKVCSDIKACGFVH